MTKDDIANLADLARVAMTDEELESMAKDFNQILGYVQVLNQIEVPRDTKPWHMQVNNVRQDEPADFSQPGQYTDRFVANAPQSENNQIKVQTVLKKRT